MTTYHNTSKHKLRVQGLGHINPGATFETTLELNHPWLERVEQEKPAKKTKKDE